jgi:hypothetical protein
MLSREVTLSGKVNLLCTYYRPKVKTSTDTQQNVLNLSSVPSERQTSISELL